MISPTKLAILILNPVLRQMHCKLATLSRRQKPTLPGRRYRSMSPIGRQSLQFYNECIKWWPSANNFQCCPRATLEIIGFGSPLDKASLFLGGVCPDISCQQGWYWKTRSSWIIFCNAETADRECIRKCHPWGWYFPIYPLFHIIWYRWNS